MRKTVLTFATAACAACLASAFLIACISIGTSQAAAESTAAKTDYTVTDLGTLGGASIARGVNTSGQVVGQSQKRLEDGTLQLKAFSWGSGPMDDLLGTLGVSTSAARGINNSGQVVGFSRVFASGTPEQISQQQAFVVDKDTDGNMQMVPLGTLPGFPDFLSSEAWAINESGQIVGRSSKNAVGQVPISSGRAFLSRKNKSGVGPMVDLGVLSPTDTYSEAWAINDYGQVVGESGKKEDEGQAFLYSGGSMRGLGTLPDYPYSEAFGIDNSGQIVGWSYSSRANVRGRAFLYKNEEMKDLGALEGDLYSMARAIDEHGRVVGQSRDASGQNRAFLWENGQMTNLNSLVTDFDPPLAADSPLRLLDAYAISDSGKIVGSALNKAGQVRAFLLTPNDATAPNTTATTSPDPNAAGWFRGSVEVSLEATDEGGSNVKAITYSLNGDQHEPVPGNRATFDITTEGETTITYSAKDHAGNVEEPKTLTIRLDRTRPNIECGTADDLWHKEDVSISCTASDDGVGLADPADASFTLTTSVPAGTETTDARSDSREVCDAAGNCATVGPISGIKVDKKAPDISITTSPGGGEYELGDDVTVSYDCADGGSGLDRCVGTEPDGGNIDTASVGRKTFTVEAADKAGNVASESFVYSVVYDFGGFFSPVDELPVLNRAKAGSAIPVKFSLGGDQGLDIFATAEDGSSFPKSGAIDCDSTEPIDPIEQTVTANSSGLTYDASTDLYTYVWKTNRDWTGCRQLVVKLDDGEDYRANFKFTR